MLRHPSRPLFFRACATGLAMWWLLALPVSASETDLSALDWSDTSRDVYVDGELEPAAIILAADSEATGAHLAILSESLERAYIVHLESLEISEVPLSHFTFNATGATSPVASETSSQGRATRIRDRRTTFFVIGAGDHTLVIAPHQGQAGSMQSEELFESAPSWRRRAAGYEPEGEAVAALRALERNVEVTVAFGTWCGDSRNYVPKLMSALEEANNPHIQLDLVAIHRGFDQPADLVLGQRITNVPTIIVREAGEEIGRIVETPIGTSIESDLAAILDGELGPHPGRWDRETEIARGRYVYEDADDRPLGEESWVLYRTEGGGRLLHSRMQKAGDEVEIWHRRDPEGASEFVELTRHHDDELSRTRIWIDDRQLRALTRGNATGIVEQRLSVPEGTSFLLPCAAEAGFGWPSRAETQQDSVVTGFLLSGDHPTAGKVVTLKATAGARETVETSVGPRSTLRLAAHHGRGQAEWWLDETLGMPLRGEVAGLGRVRLAELSLAGDEPVAAR